MPSVQRGQVFKLAGVLVVRYYQDGRRRQHGGYQTKGEASKAAAALQRAQLGPDAVARQNWTITELVDRYMAQHQAAPATLARLRAMLAKATATFGDVPVMDLLPDEIGAWRMRIPEGHRHDATQAFRQVLNAAVKWKVIPENPAKLVRTRSRSVRRSGRSRHGRTSRRSRSSSARRWARSRSSPPQAGSGRRSGWRQVARRRPTRTCRYRPARLLRRRTPRLGQDRPLAQTRAAPPEGRGRARAAPAASRHEARVPGAQRHPHEPAQLAVTGLEARDQGRRDRPGAPHLRPATHVRHLESRRRRLTVLARPQDGHQRRHDRRTYGHLAPDAESYERELLDAFDAKTTRSGSYRAPKPRRGGAAEAGNALQIGRSRRADSNRGPLHYE